MSSGPTAEARGKPKVYGVGELTRRIKSLLEDQVGAVWLEGELSNVRRPSSGHLYFTIKDERAQIAAVLFRGNQRGLRFEPRDGLQVRVYGEISVYEKSGNYQIIVRRMEAGGQGALQAAFEKLKEKLRREGLFDAGRKRPIPLLPRRVGVVTSPTGAAIRDILNVVTRRFPNLQILLAPVKVQGEGAAEQIARAVALLNERGGLDVLLVGRGGGSLEDLWCFNEEIVARALAASRIPVIAAVGHEIDFTIADFVADLRAPTPSAGAELVVGRKDAFEERLSHLDAALKRSLRERLLRSRHRLSQVAGHPVFQQPRNAAAVYRRRLDRAGLSAAHLMQGALREGHQRIDDLSLRMTHGVERRAEAARRRLERLSLQVRALNPYAVLGRGYSITRDAAGRVLRSVAGLGAGQRLSTQLADGVAASEVLAVEQQSAPAAPAVD